MGLYEFGILILIMLTLSLQSLHHAYGSAPVLEGVDWQQSTDERLCLVGRNGEGKSTLMRLLAGVETPDQGRVGWSEDAVIGYVPQELPKPSEETLYEFIMAGAGEAGRKLLDYQAALRQDPESKAVERLQQWLDDHMAWNLEQRAESALTQFELQADMRLSELSGGWRRKALVARALILNPNVLLLDEPTNHLDIDSIGSLENWLRDFRGLVIFISHDRQFIDAVADHIIELDRSTLHRYPAPYETFLAAREDRLRIEAEQNAEFDRRLKAEEVWIRQGIKARRTRNEGRVRRLQALRQQRAERREVGGSARMSLAEAERSGRLVFELKDLSFSYPERPIVSHFSTEVMRGDTVALLGPNGVGKTTLVRLLLGQLAPDSGQVRTGTGLEVAYFDQGRHQLDPERTVMDTVSEGRDFIDINGQRVHIISWLERFLFSPAQARSPVKTLSGGEANRLLLARLFSQPANLLVLDEPTNDLDIDTLELLEELITEFSGTVILISHDRYFIDNVATRVWGLPGGGEVVPLVGGYREWQEWLQRQRVTGHKTTQNTIVGSRQSRSEGSNHARKGKRPGKLSYKIQREYDQLPARIEQLEQLIAEQEQVVADPAFYQGDPDQVHSVLEQLGEYQAQLDAAMERWLELEEQVSG